MVNYRLDIGDRLVLIVNTHGPYGLLEVLLLEAYLAITTLVNRIIKSTRFDELKKELKRMSLRTSTYNTVCQ